MALISPDRLILRCYGKKQKNGRWYGLCLNFNIAVEADSPHDLKIKLKSAINTYIDATLDTDDSESIPLLISRQAPFLDWVVYYWVRLLISIRKFPDNFTFNELIPFKLASNC